MTAAPNEVLRLCILGVNDLCPIGQLFKSHFHTLPGEGDAAREEHGGGGFVLGAVFVVAYQGEAAAGKLHPDLVAAASVQPDAN